MERIYTDIEGQSRLSFDTKTTSKLKSKKIFNYNPFPFIVSAIIVVLFLFPSELLAQITTLTTTSPGTLASPWTVPTFVTKIKVEAWGAGGGGGGASDNKTGGSGGGGGGYTAYSTSVTPSTLISFSVGTGGAAGTYLSTGGTGGTTSILDLTAFGGTGGQRNTGSPGAGGDGSGGTTNMTGNPGIRGTSIGNGTGGAGGAGANGGAGGAIKTAYGNGNPGTIPGGGGGGGLNLGSLNPSGGTGASGQVSISFSNYALTSTSATNACIGSFGVVTLNSTVGSLPAGTYTLSYTYSGANSGTVNNQGITITGTSNTTGSFNTANFSIAGSTTITINKIENTDYGNLISTNRTATINVNANLSAVSITPSTDQTICEDGTGTPLTANETGGGIITSRAWGKRSVTGGVITPISGATGNTYLPTGASLGSGSWLLVCTSTPTCGPSKISADVPITVLATGTFIGADATNPTYWEDPDNWCGGVPNINSAVIIPDSKNVVINTTSAECRPLTINSGGSVTIKPGAALTVNSTFTNNTAAYGLYIESDATGTGSFINKGTIAGTGKASIQRYLTNYHSVPDSKFHFLSSPVGSDQAINPVFCNPVGSTDLTDFYKWDETLNLWINYRGATSNTINTAFGNNFEAGKGYLVAYPTDITKTFTGTPYSTSELAIPCSYTASEGLGWNLVGNPFPSAIDWDLVNKNGNNLDDALYYYVNDLYTNAGGYKYYIPLTGGVSGGSRYIPAMQGFMVHAKSGGGTLRLSNSHRVHNSLTTYYKNATLQDNILNLKIEGNNVTDEARVCYYDQASSNFDGAFDAYKLFCYDASIPQLYSVTSDNIQVAINTLPLSEMYGSVPVGFRPGMEGNYTFTADGVGSFPSNVYIKLEDKKTGTVQKLNDNPIYAFASAASDNSDRFVLHFQDATSINNPEVTNNFTVYVDNGTITINQLESLTGTVKVSDMLGRTIAMENMVAETPLQINLNSTPGVYVVTVYTKSKTYSQKVVIR